MKTIVAVDFVISIIMTLKKKNPELCTLCYHTLSEKKPTQIQITIKKIINILKYNVKTKTELSLLIFMCITFIYISYCNVNKVN